MTDRARVLLARAMTCIGAAFIVAAMGSAHAQVTKVIYADPIKTDAGLVSGTMSAEGLKTYFGIPFAAPPIRENRWRAPQPVTPWHGVLTANRKPSECVQG